jgi:thiamine-phosphate pyrophosphorylase
VLNRGLYVITDTGLGDRLLPAVEQALRGGAVVVQYRDKSDDRERRLGEARALATLCRFYHVPLLINDDVDLAVAIKADGVHLGRGDGSLRTARQRLGANAILGATCHDSLIFAAEAAAHGADYLAFGAMFPSPTKPLARRADPALLTDARVRFGLPVVAIGGITVDNAPELIAAGADNLAVITDIFGLPTDAIRARAEAYGHLFQNLPGEGPEL